MMLIAFGKWEIWIKYVWIKMISYIAISVEHHKFGPVQKLGNGYDAMQ